MLMFVQVIIIIIVKLHTHAYVTLFVQFLATKIISNIWQDLQK